MSIDLGQFETGTEGEWLELLHPVQGVPIRDEDGNALRVQLVGKDSKQYRDAQRKITERRLKSRSKANRFDADAMEQEAIDVLVACTVGWEGFAEEGKDLEFKPANIRRVYDTHPWIKEQVDEFVDDRGNFMQS
jgi:hypothetical protein